MCGIAGVLQLRGGRAPAGEAQVRAMLATQAHRGPDGEGVLALGPLVLGHRRLAVLDPTERSAQPMRLDAGHGGPALALSYNGEVYDYRELRAELQAAGERFTSDGDTEVVLRGYARWGEAALPRLNGMFAVALWDERRRRLVLARDRFGIKPLYVYEDAERLVFASELKAIVAAVPRARAVEPGVLARFLQGGVQDDGPATFFRGVRQVPPGHVLTIDLTAGEPVRRQVAYWTFDAEAARRRYDYRDPAATLRGLLEEAVALRLRSDVPLGTCLSGGLDSSAIVALAAGRLSEPVRTFTAVYDDRGYDERRYARAVAGRFGCQAVEVRPRPGAGLVALLDLIGWYHDEPCARPGLVTQWYVMAAAAEHVTVLLDGQGGDELLLGYASYALPYLRSLGAAALRQRDPRQGLKLIRDACGLLAQRSTSSDGPGTLLRHVAAAGLRRLGSRSAPALPDALRRAAAQVPRTRTAAASGLAEIDRLLRDEVASLSLPALLHHEDRASMAFSLEARVPFLDPRVAEFSLGLDYRAKVEGGATKAVLRRAMADLLPPEVLARRDKLGYPTPLRRWLREAEAEVQEVLLDGFAARGLVPAHDVERAVRAAARGRGEPWRLFRWLTAELWLARFIDRPPAPPRIAPALELPTPAR